MRCRSPAAEQRNRLVVLVAGDLTQILDLAGPAEVFSPKTFRPAFGSRGSGHA